MNRIFLTFIVVIMSLAWTGQGYAQLHPEKRLIQALEAIQATQLDRAETLLRSLINDEPEVIREGMGDVSLFS